MVLEHKDGDTAEEDCNDGFVPLVGSVVTEKTNTVTECLTVCGVA